MASAMAARRGESGGMRSSTAQTVARRSCGPVRRSYNSRTALEILMNVSFTERFTTDDAVNIYGLDGWGNGYFAIGEDGHLLVTPGREPARAIDVYRVIEDLSRRGVKTPVLLRFPQLLEGQVNELAQ